MTPSRVDRRVIADRLALIDGLLVDMRALPLANDAEFTADRRNLWTLESCLRRSLEALFDIGRHILAKGFARGATEYREIAVGLGEVDVLGAVDVALLGRMAGYRNRLVHLYHDVGEDELLGLGRDHLGDIEQLTAAYRQWLIDNPQLVTDTL